mgnify:FL=1
MIGKVLGLDLGEKTLGIAESDLMGIIAQGIENFRFEDNNYDIALDRVIYYVKKDDIKEIALGLPLHMSGDESEHSKLARLFKTMIGEKLPNIKVVLIDERWTTKQANRRLLEADLSRKKRKNVIDKMSAVVILETYLQMRG